MIKRFADEPSDKASERLRQFEEARGDVPDQQNEKSGASPKPKKSKPGNTPSKKSKPNSKKK